MAKISISKKQLDKIIQEETENINKALTLKKELRRIQSELKQLNEVQAGEPMDPKASGGVHAGQKKAKFSTKKGNPYLQMEDNEEGTVDADDTNNPGNGYAGDIRLTFYPKDYFINEDTGGTIDGPAAADEDSVQTFAHVTVFNITVS